MFSSKAYEFLRNEAYLVVRYAITKNESNAADGPFGSALKMLAVAVVEK